MLPYSTPPTGGGLYVIRLSDTHYYGGRAACFATRWRNHHRALLAGAHPNTRMQRVFDKHGVFSPVVLVLLDRDEQTGAEQAWLDQHHGQPGCVNISPFAVGGNFIEWTPFMRQRQAQLLKGSARTLGAIEKQRHTYRSRPDLVAQARVSLSKVRHLALTPEAIAKRAAVTAALLRGRSQPSEIVLKRAESNRGRKNTPETLRKMSDSAKRRVATKPQAHGDSTRALISAQQKGRIWLNNGQLSQRVFPEDAAPLMAEGWVRGRLPRLTLTAEA